MLPFQNPASAPPKPIQTSAQLCFSDLINLLTHPVEQHRPGYPRFTALLSAHNPYFLCRQFNKLRARLLLLKQDQLSVLEQRLEQIDQQEESPLFLGKSRCDRNTDRISLLSEIEGRLADYGTWARWDC